MKWIWALPSANHSSSVTSHWRTVRVTNCAWERSSVVLWLDRNEVGQLHQLSNAFQSSRRSAPNHERSPSLECKSSSSCHSLAGISSLHCDTATLPRFVRRWVWALTNWKGLPAGRRSLVSGPAMFTTGTTEHLRTRGRVLLLHEQKDPAIVLSDFCQGRQVDRVSAAFVIRGVPGELPCTESEPTQPSFSQPSNPKLWLRTSVLQTSLDARSGEYLVTLPSTLCGRFGSVSMRRGLFARSRCPPIVVLVTAGGCGSLMASKANTDHTLAALVLLGLWNRLHHSSATVPRAVAWPQSG